MLIWVISVVLTGAHPLTALGQSKVRTGIDSLTLIDGVQHFIEGGGNFAVYGAIEITCTRFYRRLYTSRKSYF